jgi:hypothetical protein
MEGKAIKIHPAKGESCWATQIGGDLGQVFARVDNIPFSGDCNLHDIVELDVDGNVMRIIAQRYACRSVIHYQKEHQFHRLCAVFRQLDCAVEGMIGPSENMEGVMMVAHYETIKPELIAEGMGIPQKKRDTKNDCKIQKIKK